MQNQYVKKKRNNLLLALFLSDFLSTVFLTFANVPTITPYFLYDLSLSSEILILFSHFITFAINVFVLYSINNSIKKNGLQEANISPAYIFLFVGLTSIGYQVILSPLYSIVGYVFGSSSGVYSVLTVFIGFFRLIINGVIIFVFGNKLFSLDDKQTADAKEIVLESKSDGTPVSSRLKTFTANRLMVMVVFAISFSLVFLTETFFDIFLFSFNYIIYTLVSAVIWIIVTIACVGIVIYNNSNAEKNNTVEGKIPLVSCLLPLSTNHIRGIISGIYKVFCQLSGDYSDGFLNMLLHYTVGIATIVVFSYLIFKHEDKKFKVLLESGYFERRKVFMPPAQPVVSQATVLPPVAQAIIQPAPQQRPVQQPVVPQAPVQPVVPQAPVPQATVPPTPRIPDQPSPQVFVQTEFKKYPQSTSRIYTQPDFKKPEETETPETVSNVDFETNNSDNQ